MATRLIIVLTLLCAALDLRAETPTGFAFTQLQSGVQLRFNGLTKNVLFYGPATVQNASCMTAGKSK